MSVASAKFFIRSYGFFEEMLKSCNAMYNPLPNALTILQCGKNKETIPITPKQRFAKPITLWVIPYTVSM